MKINDIKISTRLFAGFAIILAFVLGISAISYIQSKALWEQTESIYEHPLQVRRTLSDLKVCILSIHLEMKDLGYAKSDQEIEQIKIRISTFETVMEKEFDVLRSQYLGPKQDIDSCLNAYAEWKVIREQTILFAISGESERAIVRTQSGGTCDMQAIKLISKIDVVSKFAKNKGDEEADSENAKNLDDGVEEVAGLSQLHGHRDHLVG